MSALGQKQTCAAHSLPINHLLTGPAHRCPHHPLQRQATHHAYACNGSYIVLCAIKAGHSDGTGP